MYKHYFLLISLSKVVALSWFSIKLHIPLSSIGWQGLLLSMLFFFVEKLQNSNFGFIDPLHATGYFLYP